MRIIWLLALFAAATISAVIHNFTTEVIAAIFFIIASIFLIIFVLGVIQSLVTFLIHPKEKTDLWMLGFLGVLGFLGLYKPPLSVFFGFLGFFGLLAYNKKIRR